MGVFQRRDVQAGIIIAGLLATAWLVWAYLLPRKTGDTRSVQELREVLSKGAPVNPAPVSAPPSTPGPESNPAPASSRIYDTKARAEAAERLGQLRDEESMPWLLKAMEDEDPAVRGRAGAAVRKIMGADYFYRAEDPPERRRQAIENIRRDWDSYVKYKQRGGHGASRK